MLNRLPRTVRVNIGSNHSAALWSIRAWQGCSYISKAKDFTILRSHTLQALVLRNLPLFHFAVALLSVYGVLCLLGLTTCSWTSKVNFPPIDHLVQLALREVKNVSNFFFLKYVFCTLGGTHAFKGTNLTGCFSCSLFLKGRNDTLTLKDFSKELFDVHFRGHFTHYHLDTCRVLTFRKVAEIAGYKMVRENSISNSATFTHFQLYLLNILKPFYFK